MPSACNHRNEANGQTFVEFDCKLLEKLPLELGQGDGATLGQTYLEKAKLVWGLVRPHDESLYISDIDVAARNRDGCIGKYNTRVAR